MFESFHIRAATSEDARAISALVTRSALEFVVQEYTPAGRALLLESMRPEAIRARLDEGSDGLVAEAADSPPAGGLVGVSITRDDSHLHHLFVARAWHRRGVARALWKRALERCVERAGTERFTVSSSSYAREVYTRLGFRPAGPPEERDGILSHPMELRLAGGSETRR